MDLELTIALAFGEVWLCSSPGSGLDCNDGLGNCKQVCSELFLCGNLERLACINILFHSFVNGFGNKCS